MGEEEANLGDGLQIGDWEPHLGSPTPNLQLPTPKEWSLGRYALGVGSWELGVGSWKLGVGDWGNCESPNLLAPELEGLRRVVGKDVGFGRQIRDGSRDA